MSVVPSREAIQGMLAKLSIRHQAFIGGRFVDSASGKVFENRSPATGEALAAVAECDVEDVDRAVAAARRAFEKGTWRKMAPSERRTRLLRLAQLIDDHRLELAVLETLDCGKPIRDASNIDLPATLSCFRFYAEAIDKLYDELAPTPRNVVSMITREPLGVVGAVVPWNFPLVMAAWKVAPALAMGNSVVLKPAEQSPLSALRLAELAVEAGLPEGVFNVVLGFGETAGQALGRHMDVDALGFTGSAEVGKLFLTYAGQSNMKVVFLECGGKSPIIVMADADLEAAAKAAIWGVCFNQGEVCNSTSRLIVEKSIKDSFLDSVLNAAKTIRIGEPLEPETQMGPMIDDKQAEQAISYIEVGKQEGAKLVLGGKRRKRNRGTDFIEPTVFDNVTNQMRIAREEIFGPVLSTLTCHDLDDALKIGNDTIYGLSASIWTSSVESAMAAVRELRAGQVWVNSFHGGDITSPFGGFRQSGFGRDKSLHALNKYVQLKCSWIEMHRESGYAPWPP